MINSIDLEDTQLLKIANYLQESLNKLSEDWTNMQLVKSVHTFDNMLIPRNEYPCLKVFRVMDTFSADSNLCYTDITIKYSVSTSDFPALAKFCYFISRFLNSCLLDIEKRLQIQIVRNQKQITYGSVSYNQQNPIIDLITLNFRIVESSIPNKIIEQLKN